MAAYMDEFLLPKDYVEHAKAFAWLNRAIEERTHWLVWLKLDPRWNPIRWDDRFRDVQRRVGFPE